MKDGSSLTAFAASIGTHRDTMYAWEAKYPDFSDAIKEARSASQSWWELQARQGLFTGTDEKFSASTWIFNMKARFGYRDVQQVEQSVKVEKAFDTSKMSKEEYMEFITNMHKGENDGDND